MDLLPTKATTATSVVTRIFGKRKILGGDDICAYISENGRKKETTVDKAKETILNYQVKDANHPVEVIFEIPGLWIGKDIEIRDTPGMGDSSQDGKLETIALNAMKDTDMCVLVYDAGAMMSSDEKEKTLRIWQLMGGNVVYAVNCTNHLNSMQRVKEVESLCEKFFGSMKYHLPGMGKYYMMCSAPKMIELDGFDTWLKKIAGPGASENRRAIRSVATNSRYQACRMDVSATVSSIRNKLVQSCKVIEELHSTRLSDKKKSVSTEVKKRIETFSSYKNDASQELLDIDYILSTISGCKGGENWQSSYSENTKNAALEYFNSRADDVCNQWSDFFRKSDFHFINTVFSHLSFPERHTRSEKASGGEAAGGALAGALIGNLLFPGVGFLIGGAFGGLVGGSDNTVDDSVENTMSYIRTTVVPELSAGYNTMFDKKIGKERNSGKKKEAECKSGFEDITHDMNELCENLKAYILS